MYGTQTPLPDGLICVAFENDVNMYGTQTSAPSLIAPSSFENDVNMYGTQTANLAKKSI